MSSANSTETAGGAPRDASLRPWHFYLLLGMTGATVAVLRAQDTQPAALLLISAAVVGAALVAIASHQALIGFFGGKTRLPRTLDIGTRQALEQEKALVLRSIKELEFDHAMRKVSDADFAELGGRLRARAIALIEQLDAPPPRPKLVVVAERTAPVCPECQTQNDGDARFCKACGTKL